MPSYSQPKPLYSSSSTPTATQNDKALPADATDTISSVRWSPVANHLAASSWDGKVRIYDVAGDLSARGVAMITAEAPVLTCDWSKDGTIVAGAGADKKVHLLHAPTRQTTSFAAHDAPVRSLRFVHVPSAPSPLIATGSWDKTVRYWDIRNTGSPLATLSCKDRVYSMDTAGQLLVIACADRHVHIVDLQANPAAFLRTEDSTPLNHQTHVVTVYPDGNGWGIGSIEGRCNMKGLIVGDKENFSFRCHRTEAANKKDINVWTVNDINFHPVFKSTFSTAGSDGSFHFWDRVAHKRLKAFPQQEGAITATAFNRDGTVFAYAIGYDWSMGYAKNSPTYPLKLMLHPVVEDEVNPKRAGLTGARK